MHHVLVIDDDAEICDLIVEILTDEGYTVRTAPDAEAGLLAIEDTPPALLLLDLQLPGMQGDTLLRILRAAGYTFPVVLVTASPQSAQSLTALNSLLCIAKPFDIDELLDCVRRYVQPERASE
jgi:DNA-binding response OmpR family regulator